MMVNDPQIISRILWKDQIIFRSNGRENLHEIHYWSTTKLFWMQTIQNRWLVYKCLSRIYRSVNYPNIIFNNQLHDESYLILREILPIFILIYCRFCERNCPFVLYTEASFCTVGLKRAVREKLAKWNRETWNNFYNLDVLGFSRRTAKWREWMAIEQLRRAQGEF